MCKGKMRKTAIFSRKLIRMNRICLAKTMMHSILCLHYIRIFFNLNKHFIVLKMQYNLLPLQNANAYLCVLFFYFHICTCANVGEK